MVCFLKRMAFITPSCTKKAPHPPRRLQQSESLYLLDQDAEKGFTGKSPHCLLVWKRSGSCSDASGVFLVAFQRTFTSLFFLQQQKASDSVMRGVSVFVTCASLRWAAWIFALLLLVCARSRARCFRLDETFGCFTHAPVNYPLCRQQFQRFLRPLLQGNCGDSSSKNMTQIRKLHNSNECVFVWKEEMSFRIHVGFDVLHRTRLNFKFSWRKSLWNCASGCFIVCGGGDRDGDFVFLRDQFVMPHWRCVARKTRNRLCSKHVCVTKDHQSLQTETHLLFLLHLTNKSAKLMAPSNTTQPSPGKQAKETSWRKKLWAPRRK